MASLEELKREAWRIVKIYLNAKENFRYCYYLYKPDTKSETEYLNIDRDLKFIRHSLWRISIIELAKLLSQKKSDEFNLLFFFSKLKPDGHYGQFNINPLKVAEWENMLTTKSNLIKNVITLRDKIYAHTDPEGDEYKEIEIYLKQIEDLFEIVGIILKEIFLVAFSGILDLRTPTYDRTDFNLVRILAQEHKRKRDIIGGNLTTQKSH